MNPVVHFEMPYNDQVRVAKFYEQAFGWLTQALGEEMGEYVLATTTEKVRRAGGTVVGEPTDIPGVGKYVSFVDTEGNRVSMFQAIPRNWHAPKNK